MKCVIPNRGIRVFGKAIHCLSKIGDELYIEAQTKGLALKTVNNARSAFSCFVFKRSFFNSYNDGRNRKGGGGGGGGDDGETLKCKIGVKSIVSVFRALSTLEKTVDHCQIHLDLEDNKLIFVFHCLHGIKKTHSLGFQECDALQAVFTKDLAPNLITAPARLFSEVVNNFPNSLEEVTLSSDPERTTLRNYVEGVDSGRATLTEIFLLSSEFEEYRIGVDTSVTFCLKEMRAVLLFTDAVSHVLSLRFESAGKPVVMSLDDSKDYRADFVLATLLSGEDNGARQEHAPPTPRPLKRGDNGPSSVGETSDVSFKTGEFSRMEEEENGGGGAPSSSRFFPPASVRRKQKDSGGGERARDDVMMMSSSNSSKRTLSNSKGKGRMNSLPSKTRSFVPEPPDSELMEGVDLEGFQSAVEGGSTSEHGSAGKSRDRPERRSVLSSSSGRRSEITRESSNVTAACVGQHWQSSSERSSKGRDPLDALFEVENMNDVADEGDALGFGHPVAVGEQRGTAGGSGRRGDWERGGVGRGEGPGGGAVEEESEGQRTTNLTLADEEFFADDFQYQDLFVSKSNQSRRTSSSQHHSTPAPREGGVATEDSDQLHSPSTGLSPRRGGVSQLYGTTQDSVINDSAFIPSTPPSKKFKASIFELDVFGGGDQTEVLAPDSEEEED